MGEIYLIYTLRGQGFLGRSGQATTERKNAKQFTREEALAWCKHHVDHNGASTSYPVSLSLLTEIETN